MITNSSFVIFKMIYICPGIRSLRGILAGVVKGFMFDISGIYTYAISAVRLFVQELDENHQLADSCIRTLSSKSKVSSTTKFGSSR